MKTIAITSFTEEKRVKLNYAYPKVFLDFGIIPNILPVISVSNGEIISAEERVRLSLITDEIAKRNDALTLSGGQDINGTTFGENNYGSEAFSSERDEFEIALYNSFKALGKPIIGICRGFQLICNIEKIGNYNQHLKDNDHSFSNVARNEKCHDVLVFDPLKSYIEKIKSLKSCSSLFMPVNSFHHQSIDIEISGKAISSSTKSRLMTENIDDTNFRALAITESIFEAIESEKNKTLAVQWHPEEYQNSMIIRYFIEKYLKG
jgi:putative glutamine amidotransferase